MNLPNISIEADSDTGTEHSDQEEDRDDGSSCYEDLETEIITDTCMDPITLLPTP